MENLSAINTTNELMELPPGFRFHPTDEELITHYLSPKVLDDTFTTKAIGDVDLNKVEPWDLPWRAKIGEKEWYFFCVRDRKYPTGLRTNRATDAGYWKATGKDKEIYRAKILVGMKKTLVFYRGRAPKGEKSDWVMHEYRLEGKYSMHNVHKTTKNEWVICRIFKKSSGGKKVYISGLLRSRNGSDSQSCDMPSLMDFYDENRMTNIVTLTPEGSHVTCFSDQMEDQRENTVNEFRSASKYSDLSQLPFALPNDSNLNSTFSSRIIPLAENAYHSNSVLMQDQSILRILLENNGRQNAKAEYSKESIFSSMSNQEFGLNSCETQEFPLISTVPVDLDCLWDY